MEREHSILSLITIVFFAIYVGVSWQSVRKAHNYEIICDHFGSEIEIRDYCKEE